ncbi:MAG TPA: MauE/DoxX family redox-associated membrane protein [Flavobacteriaceae bacterium]|nr:MauE/DoxX family redox-associated membrane protein [Flavobacteriaceae bacterium]
MLLPWHQYLMAILFILAGMNHFRKPKLYERIMPNYIPAKSTMVTVTGALEMVFGLMLLIPENQNIAAWGIILLLAIYFSVHLFMLRNEKAGLGLPKWVLVLRIPLQFFLIWWAFLYA